MVKNIFYSVGLLLLFSATATAQSAQSAFNEAFSAYEAGNYAESIRKSEEVERMLGSTNARLQSLKVLNYYENGDEENALLQLELYFNTEPDINSGAYSEMSALRQEIKSSLQQNFESNRQNLEGKREAELAEISSDYSNQKDLLAFGIAKEAGTLQALELFVRTSNSDSLKQETHKMIAQERERLQYEKLVGDGMDLLNQNQPAKEMFLKAEKIQNDLWLQQQINLAKSNTALLAFSMGLADFSSENYASSIRHFKVALENEAGSEIRQKLKEAEEEYAFQRAYNNGDPILMKVYLNKYPNGTKRNRAEIFLFQYYLEQAEESLQKNDLAETETILIKIKELKSLSHWEVYSPSYYELKVQQANRLTKGDRSTRKANIGLAIAHFKELDEESGERYRGRLGILKWKQKEWNRPDMFYFTYKTDPSFNDIGFETGSHDNSGIGIGINIQFSKQLLNSDTSSEFELNELDHIKGLANISLSKKLLYPIWLYGGGGWAHLIPIIPGENDSKGIMDGENAVNTLNFIGGVNIHFKPVVLTLGAGYPLLNDEHKLKLGLEENPLYITVGAGLGW